MFCNMCGRGIEQEDWRGDNIALLCAECEDGLADQRADDDEDYRMIGGGC